MKNIAVIIHLFIPLYSQLITKSLANTVQPTSLTQQYLPCISCVPQIKFLHAHMSFFSLFFAMTTSLFMVTEGLEGDLTQASSAQ